MRIQPSGRPRLIPWFSLLALLLATPSACQAAQANEVIVNPKVRKPQVATAKQAPVDKPHFELAARISLSQGYVKEAAWINNDAFITLVVRPDGAQVLRFSYETLRREKFLSSEFIDKHLSGTDHADHLSWTMSPARKYLFFTWNTDDGEHKWQLVDISDPPNFKLRSFNPPAGMQIERVLFSPDDRYAVFFHDSYKEGSPVSILALDLSTGAEAWRIGNAELGFIKDAWWSGAVFDTPKFQATAMVRDGQFLKQAGLATCDLRAHSMEFTANADGVITGASGVWGQALAIQNKPGSRAPYFLLVSQADDRHTLPLTSVPADIELLSEPGLVLLANEDKKNNVGELWLINVAGGKYMVDGDCASFAVNGAGRLLVRAEQSNELRIYDFVNPGKDKPVRTNGVGDKPVPGGNRDPDEWVPH